MSEILVEVSALEVGQRVRINWLWWTVVSVTALGHGLWDLTATSPLGVEATLTYTGTRTMRVKS